MADIFAQLVDEAFGFLVREHAFGRIDEDGASQASEKSGNNPPLARRIRFESSSIRVILTWHICDELGMDVWVLKDTFWIRPADPRSFDFLRLVRMVAPEALAEAPSFLVVPFTEEALRPRLICLARLLLEYGKPLLHGDVSLCEDLLINDALRKS